MSTTHKLNFLYLIWKDPNTRRNFIVGKLTRNNNYQFEYCEEYALAEERGWKMLEAFPENKTYESESLFPVFSSRLPDPKRRDIQKILEKYGLMEYDDFDLLKKSGARLPIDTYEFIDPIFSDDEFVQRDFYIMGVRHSTKCCGQYCDRLPKIAIGDNLILQSETENPKDKFAILLKTDCGEVLGYVPRYYSRAIYDRLLRGFTYSCCVVELDFNKKCSECIKVHLSIPKTSE